VRYLGIDYGSKRIGLALSDPDGQLAMPFAVYQRQSARKDVRAIALVAVEQAVGVIVIGLPLHEDGTESASSRAVHDFVRELGSHTLLPIELLDERYTTLRAENTLRELGHDGRKIRSRVDASAAAIILQDYLDSTGD
jgi:putative Holliday junction resolvase